MGIAAGLDRYALNELAARAGRMHRGGPITAPAIPSMPYAFHFDASLFAGLLRRFADERHVERTEGRITEVMRDGDTGDVAALLRHSGETNAGARVHDLTGFSALLCGPAPGGA